MAKEIQSLYSLNRGVVSKYALARVDVRRAALAGETQTNWMPRVLGGASLRVGRAYKGATYTNAAARYLKFIFATDDTALLEMTPSIMRVWINDTLLTRPAVTTTITNGTFTGSLAGWTLYDEVGAASTENNNRLFLTGNGTARAIVGQQITVAGANIGVEHALRITVSRGNAMLRVGSTLDGDEYVSETSLGVGTHSISLTPTGDFYIRLWAREKYAVVVEDCVLESAGVVTLPTPWGASYLSRIRHDQSGDVVYIACDGYQQRKIERRGTRPNARSWSIVNYQPTNGPFFVQNTSPTKITPTYPSVGTIVLVSSAPLFKSGHVGSLFSVTPEGQSVTTTSAVSGTATSSIRMSGVGFNRAFSIIISGDATASTVNLQRSYDNTTWVNVTGKSWVADTTETYNDGLDNQIIYYRLILTTRVAPDNVTMNLVTSTGSVKTYVLIGNVGDAYTSSGIIVGPDMASTVATNIWQESKWSDARGWPTSVAFHEGRLWWSGKDGVWGSVSDNYESFDEDVIGDSAPINRTIGSGPVDTINWILSLKGLALGSQGNEYIARASSLEEPLTPANFNLKNSSSQGSGKVTAIKIDQTGYFVNRSGVKLFSLDFNPGSYEYLSNNVMELCPEIGYPGIVRMDVQRLPDTRIHCVLSDGTVAVCIINKSEEVLAWIKIESTGFIEDVVTLPATDGNLDDQVYYVVKYTISGSTVRYLEKWAQEIDCRGDKQYCYLADSYVAYSGAPATVITGLGHLEGQQVVVWADGLDVGTDDSNPTWVQRYTVAAGQITLSAAASNVVVGLGYTAKFKSAKLGSTRDGRSSLNQQKRIDHLGLILADSYKKMPRYGPDFDTLYDMPLIENGTTVADGTQATYDENMVEFPGRWTTDSRVCLEAYAPRPCTVLAVTMSEVQN